MIKIFLVTVLLLFSSGILFSQISVNRDGTVPAASAMLEVKSDNSGFLPPRVTLAQRDAIQNPAEGLMVYCTDCGNDNISAISVYINGKWRLLADYCPVPQAPLAGTHVASPTQIVWYWNIVSGATGYKWNTIDNYTSAEDMGANTLKIETGLTPGTSYSRYTWAYNACGNSTATTLMQNTPACGSSITVNHMAGTVAPVTKTVTYGTVSNIPGEPSKCWITRNLGATQQATAVSDATEGSAGWYWQFNRKQGYMHDGTNRTPNTAWITLINENLSWEPANDPCGLELGSGWRVPTYTEWNNVKVSGGWTNWNGPWNSGLKLHAAGHLFYLTGALLDRGTYGYYWSSTTSPAAHFGWYLGPDAFYINMFTTQKAGGHTLRCLRNN